MEIKLVITSDEAIPSLFKESTIGILLAEKKVRGELMYKVLAVNPKSNDWYYSPSWYHSSFWIITKKIKVK